MSVLGRISVWRRQIEHTFNKNKWGKDIISSRTDIYYFSFCKTLEIKMFGFIWPTVSIFSWYKAKLDIYLMKDFLLPYKQNHLFLHVLPTEDGGLRYKISKMEQHDDQNNGALCIRALKCLDWQ